MRNLIRVVLLVFTAQNSFAQPYLLEQEKQDKLLNNQFRLILNGSIDNPVGNVAAIDLSDNDKRVTIAPTFQLKNNNLLALKFNGGISDGFAEILSNSGLNTNLSFSFDYNFLDRQKGAFFRGRLPTVQTGLFERRDHLLKESEINLKYDTLILKTTSGFEYSERVAKLKADTTKYGTAIRTDENQLRTVAYPRPQRDSLDNKININRIKFLDAQNKLAAMSNQAAWQTYRLAELGNERAVARINNNVEKLSVYGFNMGWFSFGAQVRNDAFKLFDPNDDFSDRIENMNYTSFQLRAKYSYYQWFFMPETNQRTWYTTGGIAYNRRSNYQELNSSEIILTTDYGTNSTDAMSAVKKYNVYSGDYKANIDEIVLNYDVYFYMRNLAALHLNGVGKYTESYKPRYNLGFGLLFPFRDKKSQKSIVNAEIYLNLVNVYYKTADGAEPFKEYKFGLRVAVPLEFNQIKMP